MQQHQIVSQEEWLINRTELLTKEKEFTRLRDELCQERRRLPWVKLEKDYVFDTSNGKEALTELFEGRSQLIIYHFMFGPEWKEGCPSCSFWADNFNGIVIHLQHRDINLVAVSRAKLEKLEAYKKRMGWSFKWVSSLENKFNQDYQVSFTSEQMELGEMFYNYNVCRFSSQEAPGISVFYKNQASEVFHTYSSYARGLDMLNGAYHYMDLVPKGRDEKDLPSTMGWLRRHDQYKE